MTKSTILFFVGVAYEIQYQERISPNEALEAVYLRFALSRKDVAMAFAMHLNEVRRFCSIEDLELATRIKKRYDSEYFKSLSESN